MKATRSAVTAVWVVGAAIALGVALASASYALADSSSTPPTASTTPLTLGNIRASVDTSHATVRWATNFAADSTIEYGTTTSYGSTASDPTYVTSHSILISGLASGTTYHFEVISNDGFTTAQSPDDTFTTATPATSTVATTITNVRALDVDATTATIGWHTDQLADSQVNYGTTTAYGLSASDGTNVQDHRIPLTGLASGTTYHFDVVSDNNNGTTTSADYWFTTTGSGGGGGTGSTTVPTPTLVSPANDSATTTAGQQSASWNAVTDSVGGITYVYQSSNASTTNPDGSFTSPAYTSGPLASTNISTAGTPPGTYFWHVMAEDSDGNMSAWSTTWEFTVSNTPPAEPMISAIDVSDIASTTATVTWTTDQGATSQVFYGTSDMYTGSTTEDTSDVTSHSVMLTDLAAGTTYHFMVESMNDNGTATSSDQTFMTASSTGSGGGSGTGTTTPLALSGIDTEQGTAIADGLFADGWKWIFHFVVPMMENQLALSFSNFTENGDASSTIPAANNIEYYSPESTNATSSSSAILITAANQFPATMLDLTGNASSTGDQNVDVYVDTAVPTGTASGSYTASWNAESTSTP